MLNFMVFVFENLFFFVSRFRMVTMSKGVRQYGLVKFKMHKNMFSGRENLFLCVFRSRKVNLMHFVFKAKLEAWKEQNAQIDVFWFWKLVFVCSSIQDCYVGASGLHIPTYSHSNVVPTSKVVCQYGLVKFKLHKNMFSGRENLLFCACFDPEWLIWCILCLKLS